MKVPNLNQLKWMFLVYFTGILLGLLVLGVAILASGCGTLENMADRAGRSAADRVFERGEQEIKKLRETLPEEIKAKVAQVAEEKVVPAMVEKYQEEKEKDSLSGDLKAGGIALIVLLLTGKPIASWIRKRRNGTSGQVQS